MDKKNNGMRQRLLLITIQALWVSCAMIGPSVMHAQESEQRFPIILNVTEELQLSSTDGSNVHTLLRGKYGLIPSQFTFAPKVQFVQLAMKWATEGQHRCGCIALNTP